MSDTAPKAIPDSHLKFHRDYCAAVARHYPSTDAQYGIQSRILETLVSPHQLELPRAIAEEASSIVKAFFDLRQSTAWQNSVRDQQPPLTAPSNTSVLMSYDFHIDSEGRLRLIEINTNASLSLITDELYRFHGLETFFSSDFRDEILAAFEREFHDAKTSSPALKFIGIVDEKPREQRLFVEFALYQELFATRGWESDFFDPKDLVCDEKLRSRDRNREIDLVYNRHTDFYLNTPDTAALRKAMETNAAVLTPHPWEYRLLADKDRLLEISKDAANFAGPIRSSLIPTYEVSTLDPAELWASRKKFFFKPRRSHGGKAVYRGSSMSKKTFEDILARDYLAQEMVPPPVISFDSDESGGEFKYDLRFYVYRDKIQLACARLYQGQMTNSQTPFGGVAPIVWV